jgi:hypothetical protein
MGLDVYSFIMVGVQANNHIKYISEQREVTRYDTYTGKPYITKQNTERFVFNGTEFNDLGEVSSQIDPQKDAALTDYGRLTLQCFDWYYLGDQDTIGLVLCRNVNGGLLDRDNLTPDGIFKAFSKCRELLLEIGIKETPEIRLVMWWSN